MASHQAARGLDLMDRFLASAEQTGAPSLVAAAHGHLAWVLAHLGDDAARAHAELAWEYFSLHLDDAMLVWRTAVTLAWLRATAGNTEGLDDVLVAGVEAWKRAGKPPFEGGRLFFEFDHYPALVGALERLEVQLDHEAGRAVDSPNRVTAAAAHACLARHLRRGPNSRNRQARVALHLVRAVFLLREAGDTAALGTALAAAASQAEFMGDVDKAAVLREEQTRLRAVLAEKQGRYPPNDVAPSARDAKDAATTAREWLRLDEVERRYMVEVLRHTQGRITGTGGAAAILGLNPSTLSWRIDKLGLREVLAEARRTAFTRTKKRKRSKA